MFTKEDAKCRYCVKRVYGIQNLPCFSLRIMDYTRNYFSSHSNLLIKAQRKGLIYMYGMQVYNTHHKYYYIHSFIMYISEEFIKIVKNSQFLKKRIFCFCPLRYCITALIFLFSKSKEITFAMHICRTKYFGSTSLYDS